MAFINIAEWTAINTTDWLRGLDDCILPYVQFFLNNNINGCRLLLLSCDDLNNLNVRKVGHQELILDAVDLLKHLHYNFGSETLQSLALRLGCKARSLYNQLKHNQNNNQNSIECKSYDHNYNCEERVSTQTLSAVSDILAAVKAFISWIDRYPFEGQDQYIPVRKTILGLSIELASTAQRDQFVEKPNDVIKKSCITLAELCDRIVQELNDSLAIQPALLDIVTVKKKMDEKLGMHIHSSYSGIHIVGGIKFQSPSHRCGRIEEGDEIMQVSYQTVVGWPINKLVNFMREHPMEIVLTIKKRPRHSNLLGQVIVLKPYKIPNRKARLSSAGRLKNAATTTGSDGDDDAFLAEDSKHESKPVYSLYPRKPKLPVRRRATISGSSPTVGQPAIRIEDLVHNFDKKEPPFNRSVSHEPVISRSRGLSAPIDVAPTPPVPSNNNNVFANNNNNKITVNNNNIINANNNKTLCSPSPNLPYAKVHPFPSEDPKLVMKSVNETTPKKIIPSSQMTEKYGLVLIPHEDEETITLEKKRLQSAPTPPQVGVVNPSPVTVMSYQLISDIQPKSVSSVDHKSAKEQQINRLLRSPLFRKRTPLMEQPVPSNAPALRPEAKSRSKHSSRRVSCKDLGDGDCQGWLYQRKEQHGFLGSSTRWTKRWVVLKCNYLYCYKDKSEEKAECLIHLPGFTVAPAVECKSRKHAFKVFNPNTAFHFASDCQKDMSAWINKMGLTAISYMTAQDLLPEAFTHSETDESDGALSPSIARKANRSLLSSKLKPMVGSYREHSPAGLSTSSSDTKEELYGRSRITSTSSTSSNTTSNSSTFHDILSKRCAQNRTFLPNSPSLIPKSPLFEHRLNYMRSASSLEANDVIAARNRRQLLSDSSNTRYAKIVFPQSQSPKGSFSPQIPPRRLQVPTKGSAMDCSSLDRQRLNFLRDITSGQVSKMANSYNSLQDQVVAASPIPAPVATAPTQPPRPLPRTTKSINRRENVLPGFVAKMTDTYDIKTRIPSVPNTPPTRPAVPKPSDKFNGRREEQSDDTYEYVFRPTMAMIKTGIVNPLYERVPNSTWSADMPSPNSTGKSRMPLPDEQLSPQSGASVKQAANELSILDREYNRLYGTKKPNERLSPNTPVQPFVPKSASSVEIETIYTSKPRKTSSSSVGAIDDMPSSPQLTPNVYRKRPQTPSSSDNSMSSSSGISSYYSTYLEIPAEQMYRMNANSKHKTSTSSYHSAKSSTDSQHNDNSFELNDRSHSSAKTTTQPSKQTDSQTKGTKSPQKSSSFRLFSSPKLLKKLSTPKYQKERHLEKRDVNSGGKIVTTDEKPPTTPTTKTSRLFLGSPKLTRALFGGSTGSSKKNRQPPVPTNVTAPDFTNNSCDNKSIDSLNSCQTSDESTYHSKSRYLNRSSSDSSVQSFSTGAHTKAQTQYIVEKRLAKKPELTIQLPQLTESSTDSSEMPLTPETPRKPAMGVAMIGKKRRPSNVSTDRSDIESALQQYYSAQTHSAGGSERMDDTDDEWAHIVRTCESTGRTLSDGQQQHRPIDDDKLCHLVLGLRAIQRTLRPEQHIEYDAIEALLNQPITVQLLDQWIHKYPHLLPQEY